LPEKEFMMKTLLSLMALVAVLGLWSGMSFAEEGHEDHGCCGEGKQCCMDKKECCQEEHKSCCEHDGKGCCHE
jgi:hypothetical protein